MTALTLALIPVRTIRGTKAARRPFGTLIGMLALLVSAGAVASPVGDRGEASHCTLVAGALAPLGVDTTAPVAVEGRDDEIEVRMAHFDPALLGSEAFGDWDGTARQ